MKKRIFFIFVLFVGIVFLETKEILSQGLIYLEWGMVWLVLVAILKLDEWLIHLILLIKEKAKIHLTRYKRHRAMTLANPHWNWREKGSGTEG